MAKLTARGETILARAEKSFGMGNGVWKLALRSDGKILSGGTGYGWTIQATIKHGADVLTVFRNYAERRGYVVVHSGGGK